MGRPERVIGALGTLGETRQSARLAQGADALAPTGEDFVWIGLMADIPDQSVVGRVENMVDGDRQFDNAKTSPQMPARHGNRINGLGAQFGCHLPEIAFREAAQVCRG